MAQQTAVEWFRQELLKRDFKVTINELYEQALAMEKEQIIKAHYQGYRNFIDTTEISEKYYEETYGK